MIQRWLGFLVLRRAYRMLLADDTVFTGSFNLSHSGEKNAENVLELTDAGFATQLSGFVDEVRRRYPAFDSPA